MTEERQVSKEIKDEQELVEREVSDVPLEKKCHIPHCKKAIDSNNPKAFGNITPPLCTHHFDIWAVVMWDKVNVKQVKVDLPNSNMRGFPPGLLPFK